MSRSGETGNALDARCLSAIVHYRQRLVESINVSEIIDNLQVMVSDQEFEAISLKNRTNHQNVECLIDILSTGRQEQFNCFVAILGYHGGKKGKELANSLNAYQLQAGEQQWSDDMVRKVLVKGQVAIFAKITARPEKLELIRRGLRSVRSQREFPLRVLLVHGMGGSGKTVLASETVRCAPLMAECFPNGIIWKSAGHMRGLEGPDLEKAIDVLLRDILAHPLLSWKPRYDQSKPQEMTRDVLCAEIVHVVTDKQLLLVLDDVWQQDVLVALQSVPVLVLATSRNQAIVEKLPAHTDITAMKCTEQEARGIVSSHCDDVDEEAMTTLLKRCDGLPLALAIWASVLKDKPHQEQKEITLTRSEAEWLVGAFPVLPKEYECLADALEASILQLKKEMKEKKTIGKLTMLSGEDISNLYLDVAALDDDEVLFSSKLVHVWSTQLTKKHKLGTYEIKTLTRRLLEVLADRNLLTRIGGKRGKEDLFTIHDVQLDFLRALVQSLEDGTLNGRYKRWIGGFLLKESNGSESHLMVLWEHSKDVLHCEELWRIVRDIDEDEEETKKSYKHESQRRTVCWQRCMKHTVTLLEQLAKLPEFQREFLTFLLSRVSHSGWSFLHQAALEDESQSSTPLVTPPGLFFTAESLSLLLDAFPNLNIHVATTKDTRIDQYQFNRGSVPLHVAAASGKKEIVDYIIQKHECKPDQTDNSQRTPLHYASMNGKKDVVNYLILKQQCNPNQKDYINQTPLHYASMHGYVEVVKVLLDHKADIEAINTFVSTPLHYASYHGRVEVVKALLHHKADIEAKNNVEETPLYDASRQGHVEVVKTLLHHEADIEAKNISNSTPLHVASEKGYVEAVKALVDHKADIEAKNNSNWTPLHYASYNGHVEAVKALLDHKADIETKNNTNSTPLHLASQFGLQNKPEVVKVFVQRGADVNHCEECKKFCKELGAISK